MAKFVKGEAVVIPFPFSNLKEFKKRPALVLADLGGEDVILCQVTSMANKDKYSIALTEKDFEKGMLHIPSNIRPNKLFTADKGIILKSVGVIKKEKFAEIIRMIVKILKV